MLSVDQLEDKLIDLAFAEDIGDATTQPCVAFQRTPWVRAICSSRKMAFWLV